MVEHPKKHQFLEDGRSELSLPEAIGKARAAIGAICDSPLDCVKSCEKAGDGNWVAELEVIEIPARMGDNDLLSAYELTMNTSGDLIGYRRVGRYHREEAMG